MSVYYMQFEQPELEAGAGMQPKGPKVEIFHSSQPASLSHSVAALFWG